MKVLLAEDDSGMRKLMALVLRRSGFDVDEAADGHDLKEKIKPLLSGGKGKDGADIIVTDIYMPGPNALEILTLLRKAGVGVPVVMITAFGDYETHEAATRLGATAVFDKPFDFQELRSVLTVIRDRLSGREDGEGANEKGKKAQAAR